MWRRVAAEVLLRAHEELAKADIVTPLADTTGALVTLPISDRLSVRSPDEQTLERALHELGHSPHAA